MTTIPTTDFYFWLGSNGEVTLESVTPKEFTVRVEKARKQNEDYYNPAGLVGDPPLGDGTQGEFDFGE